MNSNLDKVKNIKRKMRNRRAKLLFLSLLSIGSNFRRIFTLQIDNNKIIILLCCCVIAVHAVCYHESTGPTTKQWERWRISRRTKHYIYVCSNWHSTTMSFILFILCTMKIVRFSVNESEINGRPLYFFSNFNKFFLPIIMNLVIGLVHSLNLCPNNFSNFFSFISFSIYHILWLLSAVCAFSVQQNSK